MRSVRVVIVGGGIGGLSAALAITIGQPGVHDCDVEAEARAMALRATR